MADGGILVAAPPSRLLIERLRVLRACLPALVGASAFRIACYAAMTGLALWNELRPASSVPDLLISLVPYVGWVDRVNYLAWLVLCTPLSLFLLLADPRRWVRMSVTCGLVSFVRGLCIALTGLGPPDPAHAGSGLAGKTFWSAYWDLLSPFGIFVEGTARAYLTKDLFFSGHTATTFLLVLYLWRWPAARALALVTHAIVVSTVVLAHLHYSIDIVGAWAFTFALFALREWRPADAAGAAAQP